MMTMMKTLKSSKKVVIKYNKYKIVLYNDDNSKYLHRLKNINLIHTDPPYVIHSSGDMGQFMNNKTRKSFDKLNKANISNGFDYNLLEDFKSCQPYINWQLWCSKKQFIDYLIYCKTNKYNWQDIMLYRDNALPNVRNKYQDKDYCIHIWKGRPVSGNYVNKRTDYHYKMGKKPEYKNHPALKPTQPIIHLLKTGSNKGDTVLDPFMGSGTTCIACIKTGRSFIGFEKDKKWFDMSCKRILRYLDKKKIKYKMLK